MSKPVAYFRSGEGVKHIPEVGSLAFDMMVEDGGFTRINEDGSDYVEPEKAEEAAADGTDQESADQEPEEKPVELGGVKTAPTAKATTKKAPAKAAK